MLERQISLNPSQGEHKKKSDYNPTSEESDWEMYMVPWEHGAGAVSPIYVGQRQEPETTLSLKEWVGVCQCKHRVSQAAGICVKAERLEWKSSIGKGLFLHPPPHPDPFPHLPISSPSILQGSMLLPQEIACSSPKQLFKYVFLYFLEEFSVFQMLIYYPLGDCFFWSLVYFPIVCLFNIYLYQFFTYPGHKFFVFFICCRHFLSLFSCLSCL